MNDQRTVKRRPIFSRETGPISSARRVGHGHLVENLHRGGLVGGVFEIDVGVPGLVQIDSPEAGSYLREVQIEDKKSTGGRPQQNRKPVQSTLGSRRAPPQHTYDCEGVLVRERV